MKSIDKKLLTTEEKEMEIFLAFEALVRKLEQEYGVEIDYDVNEIKPKIVYKEKENQYNIVNGKSFFNERRS